MSEKASSSSEKKEDKNDLKVEPIWDDSYDFPIEIKAKVIEVFKKYDEKTLPTTINQGLKKMLDKNFGSGWCVVSGGHYSGSFIHVEKMYAEIKFGNLIVIIFRIYVSQK